LFTYIKELKMRKRKDYTVKIEVLYATAVKMKRLRKQGKPDRIVISIKTINKKIEGLECLK